MVDRAERALSDEDIAQIAGTFHAWRGIESDAATGEYADVPGFCYSATLAEIKAADYALTPGRYVGAADVEDDGEPIEEKLARLRAELEAQFDESARLAEVVREQLGRVRCLSRDRHLGQIGGVCTSSIGLAQAASVSSGAYATLDTEWSRSPDRDSVSLETNSHRADLARNHARGLAGRRSCSRGTRHGVYATVASP